MPEVQQSRRGIILCKEWTNEGTAKLIFCLVLSTTTCVGHEKLHRNGFLCRGQLQYLNTYTLVHIHRLHGLRELCTILSDATEEFIGKRIEEFQGNY